MYWFFIFSTPLSTKDKERLFDTFTMDPSRRERYGDQKIRSKVVLSLFGHSLVEFDDHLRRIKGPKPSPPLDTIQTL